MAKRLMLFGVVVCLLAFVTNASADLVAHWPFDDGAGATAADISGNGHDGTIVGAAWASPGWDGTGSALDFDGIDDLIELGKFDVIGSGITLAAWINAEGFGITDARIISKANEWGGNDHWWMFGTFGNGSSLRFRLKTDESATTATLISDPVLELGTWTHVAATWDGSTMRIYSNAVEIASMAKGGSAVAVDPAISVAIGSQPSDAFATLPSHVVKFFDGRIDDVRIYSHALSAEELAAIIPEPATVTLLGLGGLAMLGIRRKR